MQVLFWHECPDLFCLVCFYAQHFCHLLLILFAVRELKYDQAQDTCDNEQHYRQRTTHSVVLTVQMVVQVHDQGHAGSHRIALTVGQNLRYIEHLQTTDQGCDHYVDQNRLQQR